jgi:Tir chaperone protein (CesT) family
MSLTALPEALAKLAHQRGLSSRAWYERGRLDLRVDERKRVKLKPGRRAGEVVIEAKLVELPAAADVAEALLARVMLHVTANASQQVGVVALSQDGRRLLLQALVDGADVDAFERALESYLNEFDRWLAVVGNLRS